MPASDTDVAVSIVVPVRNEAENIIPLITEIAVALDGRFTYEIIYVNDGSTDATAERLATEMKQRANLRRIDHVKSAGQSAAVRNGVRAARGKIVATLDGDGQNDPAFLPALMRREGYEIAYVDVIDRPRHSGVSNYGFFDRLWIGILDLFGVWWLIRRKKPTPVATEVKG